MAKTIGVVLSLQDKCTPVISKIAQRFGMTEKEAKRLNAELRKQAQIIDGQLKGAIQAGSVAIGAIAGATAMFINKTAEAGDRVDKMSQKIGLSRQKYQEWDYILSQSGSDIDKMQVGMKTLSQQMVASVKKGSDAEAMFKKLGVSVKDSNGNFIAQEEAFERVIIAFQKMPDGIEKANLAQKLFGKTGSDLRPLLNGVRGDVEELKKKYKELLDGDVKFLKTEQYTYSEVSKWMYLYEFLGLNENYDPSDVFNGDSQGLGLIFFDADGDEAPELCVTEHVGAGAIHDVYIFKYEIDSDRILLLKSYSGPVSQLFGTKTIGICWEDRQFRLEKFGLDLKKEMTVEFMNDFFYLDGNNNYLVSFPVYTDQNKRIELGNEIKRQGYYDESRELFFFHVTKEQYNELTNSFFDAYSKLDMKQEQVTYTYKELFKTF